MSSGALAALAGSAIGLASTTILWFVVFPWVDRCIDRWAHWSLRRRP